MDSFNSKDKQTKYSPDTESIPSGSPSEKTNKIKIDSKEESLQENFRIIPHEEWVKRKTNNIIASYGGDRSIRYGNSHLVYATIYINGEEKFKDTGIKLTLNQKISDHHTYELICSPGAFDEDHAYPLTHVREYLGGRLSVHLKQYGETAGTFMGIITQISSAKHEGIHQIIIKGSSPTLLLENGENCSSYQDKTLEEITNHVCRGYPSDLIETQLNPNYKERVPYSVQYNESDFQYLKRLASQYGEYFYYNGTQLVLSSWGSKIVEIIEGKDLYDYQIQMQVLPQKFSYTGYDPQKKETYFLDSESQPVHKSENPFQYFALNSSEGTYEKCPQNHYNGSLFKNGKFEIAQQITRERQKRQNLIYFTAKSNNPNIRLGDVVKLYGWLPDHPTFKSGEVPLESYRIIELTHHFEDGEGYSNTLVGVPRDLEVPPDTGEENYPKAEIQSAVVIDNKDPEKMGRVQVQFSWQEKDNSYTPWIQVIQPHAGQGKGTYINPEIGERVIVGFQGGSAENPIVLGTAYNGNEIAEYYTEGNDVKIICTRSNTRIVFNDSEGSILIADPSGNSCLMDGQGNIKIEAPKSIHISAKEDINISAGRDLNTTVGENNRTTVGQINDIYIKGNSNLTVGGIYDRYIYGDYSSHTEKEQVLTSEGGIHTNTEGEIVKNAQKNIKNNSGERSNMH